MDNFILWSHTFWINFGSLLQYTGLLLVCSWRCHFVITVYGRIKISVTINKKWTHVALYSRVLKIYQTPKAKRAQYIAKAINYSCRKDFLSFSKWLVANICPLHLSNLTFRSCIGLAGRLFFRQISKYIKSSKSMVFCLSENENFNVIMVPLISCGYSFVPTTIFHSRLINFELGNYVLTERTVGLYSWICFNVKLVMHDLVQMTNHSFLCLAFIPSNAKLMLCIPNTFSCIKFCFYLIDSWLNTVATIVGLNDVWSRGWHYSVTMSRASLFFWTFPIYWDVSINPDTLKYRVFLNLLTSGWSHPIHI